MAYPTRNTSTYSTYNKNLGRMLLEDGFYVLLETGENILLEGTEFLSGVYSYGTKNTSTPSYQTKN